MTRRRGFLISIAAFPAAPPRPAGADAGRSQALLMRTKRVVVFEELDERSRPVPSTSIRGL